MAWEYRHRKTRQYYYRSRKINSKVIKEYYGCGHTAQLFAAMAAERKWQREQARLVHQRQDEIDRLVDAFSTLVYLAIFGFLVSQGYYRHKGNRSHWRKRRSFQHIKNLQTDEKTKMTQNTKKIDMNEVHDQLSQLIQQGEEGDINAIMALRPVVNDMAIYDHAADLGKEVKSNLTFYMANGDLTLQENLLTEMDMRKTAFLQAVSPTSHFEQYMFDLLSEEIEICRIQTRHTDTVDARHNPQETQQKRQDRAHKRYQNVIRLTAQVHKILRGKPSVQVNVAQNQIVT